MSSYRVHMFKPDQSYTFASYFKILPTLQNRKIYSCVCQHVQSPFYSGNTLVFYQDSLIC